MLDVVSSTLTTTNSSTLKVCILVEPSPLTYVCGYANRYQALIKYLVANNDAVQVITTEVVTPKIHHWNNTVPVHYVPGFRLPHYPLMSMSLDWSFTGLRLLRTIRPDILHVSSPGINVFFGVLYARLLQIPILTSYHTHLPIYVRSYLPFGLSHMAEWLTWKLIWLVHQCAADYTVVTSPQLQAEFAAHGVTAHVWQKGVDTHRFHPHYANAAMRQIMSDHHADDFLIVCVGRLASEKRLKDLKAVLARMAHTRLCIVGTGPQEEELKAYFGNTPTVFTGQLTGDELSSAYASADVFCMPSDSETLGFVVLESMASGVPVVAANAGGIPNLIEDGVTGYLVPVGDTDAYVDRLELLRDEFHRDEMARMGRADTLRWSWDASMQHLREEHYAATIEKFHNRWEQRLFRLLTFRKRATS